MEQREVVINFKRSLKSDEQKMLISHVKGSVEAYRNAVKSAISTMGVLDKLAGVAGIKNVGTLKDRAEAMLATSTDEKGKVTSEFERNFCLDYDEKQPTRYVYRYAYLSAIFGLAGITNAMRKRGLGIDSTDKLTTKQIIKEAGLIELLDSIETKTINK